MSAAPMAVAAAPPRAQIGFPPVPQTPKEAGIPATFIADLVLKVKEPQAAEVGLLREGQTLFTYLHLAADPAQANPNPPIRNGQ